MPTQPMQSIITRSCRWRPPERSAWPPTGTIEVSPLARPARRRVRSGSDVPPDGGDSALDVVVDTLWPGGVVHRGSAASAGATRTFLALPAPANPSLLLPLHPSQATAAVLRAH